MVSMVLLSSTQLGKRTRLHYSTNFLYVTSSALSAASRLLAGSCNTLLRRTEFDITIKVLKSIKVWKWFGRGDLRLLLLFIIILRYSAVLVILKYLVSVIHPAFIRKMDIRSITIQWNRSTEIQLIKRSDFKCFYWTVWVILISCYISTVRCCYISTRCSSLLQYIFEGCSIMRTKLCWSETAITVFSKNDKNELSRQ